MAIEWVEVSIVSAAGPSSRRRALLQNPAGVTVEVAVRTDDPQETASRVVDAIADGTITKELTATNSAWALGEEWTLEVS